MSVKDRWLLPDGIEEVLPNDARRIEMMRGRVLSLFDRWGYERVMPPMVEFLDSLLTGVGREMDLLTFKVTDQLSGRMMGIRPDMTPQAARIDAHFLNLDGPVRLCYLGAVLHTRLDEFGGSREPIQLGAELFGDNSEVSEAEIVALMLATLNLFEIPGIHLDIGHVGIFRGLSLAAGLDEDQESELFDAIQLKAGTEVERLTSSWNVERKIATMLSALVSLNGDQSALAEAASVFKGAPQQVMEALDSLNALVERLRRELPGQALYFDLAELSGYSYYTGAVFSAFVPGHGRAIAKGGRYNGIGRAFGRDRPATGFSADLKQLLQLSDVSSKMPGGILAPQAADDALRNRIEALRADGERVVRLMPGQDAKTSNAGCDRELVKENNAWIVKPI